MKISNKIKKILIFSFKFIILLTFVNIIFEFFFTTKLKKPSINQRISKTCKIYTDIESNFYFN